jgi:drug/metabolite transporter (DMT)-like permease
MTTAIFSVIFLGTILTRFKWLSLSILTAGVILIQIDINSGGEEKVLDSTSIMKGSAATLLAAITSGYLLLCLV